jgi:predicted peptidase
MTPRGAITSLHFFAQYPSFPFALIVLTKTPGRNRTLKKNRRTKKWLFNLKNDKAKKP